MNEEREIRPTLALDVVQEESFITLSNNPTPTSTENSAPFNAAESSNKDEDEVDQLVDEQMDDKDAANLLASVALGSGLGSGSHAVPNLPDSLPVGYNKDLPICYNCKTQTTPLWRRSHDSTQVLCNACAFYKMKGRPRPAALKTDVIKQRNRSKGKSTSKDRLGSSGVNGGPSGSGSGSHKSRGSSTSRTREEGKGVGKSSTGGSEMDDDDLDSEQRHRQKQQDSIGRKARKVIGGVPYPQMPGYPNASQAPAYPYPYPNPYQQSHPHQHQPYPPPRSRSRSTSTTRRAPSAEGSRSPYPPGQIRGVAGESSSTSNNLSTSTASPPSNQIPYPYPPPPPGTYLPHPSTAGAPHEAYYPYYPGYPYPGQPYYPPPPPGYAPHPHPHSLIPAPTSSTIKHAQSDSRSQSPSSAQRSEANDTSPRSSASPPHHSTSNHPPPPSGYYPHLSLQPHHPYNNSPLSTSTPASLNHPTTHRLAQSESRERVTLAPMNSSRAGSVVSEAEHRSGSRERIVLPSIGSVTPTALLSGTGSPAALPTMAVVQRHTALFESRFPPSTAGSHSGVAFGRNEHHRHHHQQQQQEQVDQLEMEHVGEEDERLLDRTVRGHSIVSSNSAASASGSESGERGIQSPEMTSANLPGWAAGVPRWEGGVIDERRGRPERRYGSNGGGIEEESIERSLSNGPGNGSGGRGGSGAGSARRGSRERNASLGGRMIGVESGFEDLRVVDRSTSAGSYSVGSPRGAHGNGNGYANGTESSRSRSSGGHNGQEERGRGRGAFSVNGTRSGSTSRGLSTSRASNSNNGGAGQQRSSSNNSSSGRLNSIDEVTRLKTKIKELTFLNSLMQNRLGQLEPAQVGGSATPEEMDAEDSFMQEDLTDSISVVGKTAEDLELDRYFTASDPDVKARLLQFFRSQQDGLRALSGTAEEGEEHNRQ